MAYFIDVILPIPLRKLFTYSVNIDEARFLQPGMRVSVSFGKSKLYAALVCNIHDQSPAYETKDIEYILDDQPIVNTQQLKHWQWIADYYMCSMGEVYKAAMPKAFLLESESIVEIDQKELPSASFTDDEWLVYEALHYKTSLTAKEIEKILNKKKTLGIVKSLVEKRAIRVSEKMYEKYIPKLIKYIRLSPDYAKDDNLKNILENLSSSPKQKQLILAYFAHVAKDKSPLKAEDLLSESGVSPAILKATIEKGILEEYHIRKDRISFEGNIVSEKKLTDFQLKAYKEIKENFKDKDTVLLHGVTASGKTEIYVKLIDEVLKTKKQVLYLVPEIGLTTQLIERLKQYFGDKIAVYHSKYTTHERVEVWNNVLHSKPKAQLIIGVRSSIFLPFSNLGLIIVDEEHENSYRQFNPSPRFHARDTALVLAKLHQSKFLMGSATPSMETLHNVQLKKYGYVRLSKRFGNFQVPEIEIVDIKDKTRRKQMQGHFSKDLLTAIEQNLKDGRQVILFQNRRGYAPVVLCKSCRTVPQCPHCDVSLTYHKGRNQLRCHYCGYSVNMPEVCMACGSTDLSTKGFGTEQIDKELSDFFPKANIDRMDQDTTRGKYGFEKIISQFEQHETDILVGTQMVSKGLDFENVGLVGVMDADALIHFPDFRAYERAFQMLLQVSGRAGRGSKKGKVIIQTYNPLHEVLKQVTQHDFKGMYQNQSQERNTFHYPPYVKLIKITLKHNDFNKINEGADWLARALRNGFANQTGLEVLGPEFPTISRIRNEYVKDILIKIAPDLAIQKVKDFILRTEISFQATPKFRSIRVQYFVD